MMRGQPRECASSNSASRRAQATPLPWRNCVVQSSSRPIVQGCSVLTASSDSLRARHSTHLAEPLLAVVVAQRLDQLAHLAGYDRVELVQRQVDAVVGQPVLWE